MNEWDPIMKRYRPSAEDMRRFRRRTDETYRKANFETRIGALLGLGCDACRGTGFMVIDMLPTQIGDEIMSRVECPFGCEGGKGWI